MKQISKYKKIIKVRTSTRIGGDCLLSDIVYFNSDLHALDLSVIIDFSCETNWNRRLWNDIVLRPFNKIALRESRRHDVPSPTLVGAFVILIKSKGNYVILGHHLATCSFSYNLTHHLNSNLLLAFIFLN